MTEGISASAKKHGIPFSAQSIGSMFGLYFSANVPTSYAEVMASDKVAFNRFFHAMLAEGVYLAPSAFEAGFVSAAHTDADIAATIAAADKIFAAWK
jgi:glutamate-1-semialdehyde 2,1-aminomutase